MTCNLFQFDQKNKQMRLIKAEHATLSFLPGQKSLLQCFQFTDVNNANKSSNQNKIKILAFKLQKLKKQKNTGNKLPDRQRRRN